MPLTSEGARTVIMAFGGNVAQYSDAIGMSDKEMMEPYIRISNRDFDETHIERLCRPHLIQPTSLELEALQLVALSVLELKKNQYFYSSMEGDYMLWDIHFAEKVLTGQPFTDNDWDMVRGFRVMAENGEWVDADQQFTNDLVTEKLKLVRDVRPEGESIFDMVLC